MDQVKIGKFLAELRKEKEMTQEQLAEELNVARRTVSRWETGSNMPDIDILIELSDLYAVDLREILTGERKSETMNNETKETVLKAVDYANTESEKCNKRVRLCNSIGLLFMVVYMLSKDTELYAVNHTVSALVDVSAGIALGMLLTGLLFSSRYGAKIRAFKQRAFKRQ
jgi:transcriptional regulator with XRE-family HTH domain